MFVHYSILSLIIRGYAYPYKTWKSLYRLQEIIICNVLAKSVMHGIGKRKNATAKFSGQVTCFIQYDPF